MRLGRNRHVTGAWADKARGRAAGVRNSGFTIAELMVVVLIMGLISYTVSVSFEALLPRERLNHTVRKLSAELFSTRSDAIARSAEFWLEYDLDEQRYRVQTPYRVGGGTMLQDFDDVDEQFMLPWQVLEPGIEFAAVHIAGEEYTDGQVMVRFDPLGGASDHLVILTQPEFDNFFTIEVMALSGFVRLHPDVHVREHPDDTDFN